MSDSKPRRTNQAAPQTSWLLLALGVPTSLVALCHRCGLRATRRKPQNFYRKFAGVAAERATARSATSALKAAGLAIKWVKLEEKQTDLPTLTAQTAKELRLAQEAYKRAREERRQAETRATRDAYDRAQTAIRRARGDRPGDYSRRREPLAP